VFVVNLLLVLFGLFAPVGVMLFISMHVGVAAIIILPIFICLGIELLWLIIKIIERLIGE